MEQYGFFNAESMDAKGNYDRTYYAEDFAKYFASFITNGIFAKHESQLKVIPSSPASNSVVVKAGQAWISGYWYENTEDLILSVPKHSSGQSSFRVDAITLRLDLVFRQINLMVITGDPNTGKVPTPVRDETIYDLQLAYINQFRNMAEITESMINDQRANSEVCGWVTGFFENADVQSIYDKFKVDYQSWLEVQEEAFQTWFDGIKGKLDGDVATKLTEEVDELTKKVNTWVDPVVVMYALIGKYIKHPKWIAQCDLGGTASSSTSISIPPPYRETYSVYKTIGGVKYEAYIVYDTPESVSGKAGVWTQYFYCDLSTEEDGTIVSEMATYTVTGQWEKLAEQPYPWLVYTYEEVSN